MKKIIFSCIIVLSLFIVNISNASAKVLSWESACANFVLASYVDDDIIKIEKDDYKLRISYNEEDFYYELVLNYADNIVSFTNNRDMDKLSEEEKLLTAILDQTFLEAFNINIISLYNSTTDLEKIFELLNLLKDNGAIIIEEGESYNYLQMLSEEDFNFETREITKYQIDLAKVDALLGSEEEQTVTDLETQTAVLGVSQTNENNEQIEMVNPKTLDFSNTKYFILIVVSIIILCILISRLIPKIKKVK